MVLEYEETMGDLHAFSLFCQEYVPVFRRRNLLYKIIPPVVYFLTITILGFFIVANPVAFFLIGLLLGVAAAFVFYKFIIPRVIRRSVKKLFNRILQEQKEQSTLGRRALEFTPEGLNIKTSLAKRHLKWDAVEDIVYTKEYIFIIIGVAKAYIVPKRIFSDEEGLKDFIQTIKGFRAANH